MNKKYQEYKAWLERAEKDLKAAKDSVSSGNYEWAGFQAQQAAEKSLKAICINKNKILIKTHDCTLLARKCNAPEEIIKAGSELTPSYGDTRYPDIPKEYTKEVVEDLIKKAEEVIAWTKKSLSEN